MIVSPAHSIALSLSGRSSRADTSESEGGAPQGRGAVLSRKEEAVHRRMVATRESCHRVRWRDEVSMQACSAGPRGRSLKTKESAGSGIEGRPAWVMGWRSDWRYRVMAEPDSAPTRVLWQDRMDETGTGLGQR